MAGTTPGTRCPFAASRGRAAHAFPEARASGILAHVPAKWAPVRRSRACATHDSSHFRPDPRLEPAQLARTWLSSGVSAAPRRRFMSSVRTILIAAVAALMISGIVVAVLHYKPSLWALAP